jgi:hypothetical protein
MSRGSLVFFSIWLVVLAASIRAYMQPGESPQPDSHFASISKKVGEVSYRAPFSASWKRISEGMQLAAGTAISTKENARVVIEIKDGHILNVASNSQIVLSGLDSVQRGKTQVFLLNGTVSMKPELSKQSESKSLIQRVTTAVRSQKIFSNILDTAVGSESRKIEISAGNVSLDVTKSQSPVVISAVDDKIDILTKDPNVTARIGDKSLSILPANKALSLFANAGELKVKENIETRVFENLITLSEQTAQEALVIKRRQTPATEIRKPNAKPAQAYSAEKAPSASPENVANALLEKIDKERAESSAEGKKLIEKDYSPVVAKPEPVKPISPPRREVSSPSVVKQRENNSQSENARSLSNAALAPTPFAPTTLPATPSTFSASSAAPVSSPPLTKVWQLITPRGGVELLPPDSHSLSAMDPIKFEYKYLGEDGTEPESPTLEIFNKTNNEIRILISPDQNKGEKGIRRFRLSGAQLSELVTKSKGDRKFSFRLSNAKDSSKGENASSNTESIELRSLEDYGEGTYSISTNEYKPARPDQKRVPLVFEKNEEYLPKDRVEFVAQSRSALNTLLSRIAPGQATSLKRHQHSSEATIGAHFIEGSSLIFSVFPARRAEESIKLEWLSSAPERIVFEGRIKDFIRPESIVSTLREGEPNQTIQFVSAGELFLTRLIILRKLPGAAKRLAQDRLALFKSKLPLRIGDSRPDSTLISKPPSSFVQPSEITNRGQIATVLIASKGGVSFPTLDQLGFSSPTIFKSIPKVELEKLLKAKKVTIDAKILQKQVATELYTLFTNSLKAKLLMIVTEQPDGELTSDIYGQNFSGAVVNRSFSAPRISDLQRLFFRSFDYDGIVIASDKKWINILSQGDAPTRGQWASIYSKARSEIWLPVIDINEAPTALAKCEIVQKNGCWARVFSIEKLASEADLMGAKSKWL